MNNAEKVVWAIAVSIAIMAMASSLLAGPPFQTDDPEPVPYGHYEGYVFGTFDRARDGTTTQAPAFEFNVGAAPELQLHIVVPVAGAAGARGLGDIELGAKYRFVDETPTRPQVGVFPMLELPTGNSARGLGNGHVWLRLPVWIQKSRGPWTTYGGGGVVVNHAPGAKDAPFAGWLLQKQLSDRWTLGGEVFYQGAPTDDARFSTLFDAGGYYTIHGALSLLFMSGHSIAGETHTVGYLGLYYTWGARDSGKPAAGFMPRLPAVIGR